MLNKYENYSLTIESTCRSQFKCDAKYCINKLEHCGIRTKANYLYNDVPLRATDPTDQAISHV